MASRLVYLDGTIWNILSEQAPDGKRAVGLVEKSGARRWQNDGHDDAAV